MHFISLNSQNNWISIYVIWNSLKVCLDHLENYKRLSTKKLVKTYQPWSKAKCYIVQIRVQMKSEIRFFTGKVETHQSLNSQIDVEIK